MSTTIKDTIVAAINATGQVPHGYGYRVDRVAEALAERVEKAADTLRYVGRANGLSESLVENALIQAGLAVAPEPEPEPEPEVAAASGHEHGDVSVGLLSRIADALDAINTRLSTRL